MGRLFVASWTERHRQQRTVKAVKRRPEGTLPLGFRVRLTFLHVITAGPIPSSHELEAHVDIEKTRKAGMSCQANSTWLFLRICVLLSIVLNYIFKGLLELYFLMAEFHTISNFIASLIKNRYICLFLVGSRSSHKTRISFY